MNIEINQETLDAAISQHINRAIAAALTDYKIQDAVASRLSNEIISGAIGESIAKACEQFRSEELVNTLTREMQKAVAAGVTLTMRETVCEMVMRLRRIPDYDDAKKTRAKAEIMAELKERL